MVLLEFHEKKTLNFLEKMLLRCKKYLYSVKFAALNLNWS